MDTPEFRHRVLQDMIEEELLVQSAINNGLRISDAFLATRIQSFQAFQDDGKFSPSQYEQVLRYQGMTPTAFEWEIRRSLLTDQIREGVLRSALVTDYDEQQRTRFDEQQRSISYLIIPKTRFDKAVTITDADIEKYYQEHLERYKTVEKVRIEYVELSKSDLANAEPLSEEMLKERYQERKASFTTPGRWNARHILIEVGKEASVSDKEEAKQKVQDILAKIKAGESVEKLAKQFSDDIGSKNQGGDLGWFDSGTMVKPFEEALKSMKVGDISEPIKTRFGFHIIELVDVQPEKVLPFEQVREQLEADLKNEQADSAFYGQVEQMANLAFENPDNLETLRGTLNLERKTTDWFDKTGGSQKNEPDSILSHPKVIEIAFSDEVLKERFNSEPIEIAEQQMVVLRLKEHQPAKARPIDDVKDDIKSALKQERTQAETEKLGSNLLDQIKQKGDPNVVKEQALNWSTIQWVTRKDNEPQRVIVEQAFKMGQPAENNAIYQGITLNNGDYALIAVLDIKDGVVETAKADTEVEKTPDTEQQDKQQQAFGETEFNYFVSGLKVGAEIKDYSKKLSEDSEDI
ncbi:peptidyl-prolyl cis-trans isomerase D [Beggiatoa sp. PS]|nr:peptidyl-prolyl cis-trans isomerase D [Beggiatoa sp. PS]